MKNFKKAFTLAEATIVLVLLGVVAAIVIPSAIHNYTEKAKVARIKNAMETYTKMIESARAEHIMMNENNFYNWLEANHCANIYQYVKTSQANNCIFKSNDGLWWDVSNVDAPIVAFKRENLNSRVASDANNYNAFYMSTLYDTNSITFKVNDIQFAQRNFKLQSFLRLQKLYKYANGETTNRHGQNVQGYEANLQNLTLLPNETQTITLDGQTYQITNNTASESTFSITRYEGFTYVIGDGYILNDNNTGSDNLFLFGDNFTYNGNGYNRNVGFWGDNISMNLNVDNQVNVFSLDYCSHYNMCPKIGY